MIPVFILQCIYFYLPGGIANIGAVIGKYFYPFNKLQYPIDFNLSFRGKRLIGDHKKIGSFIFGVLLGTAFGVTKYLFLDPLFPQLAVLNLDLFQTTLLYFLISLGSLLGDSIKSVLKRILDIPPHAAWIPFDEIDHSTTALLLAKFFFDIPWVVILTTITIYFFLHLCSNFVGYLLKIKKVPY